MPGCNISFITWLQRGRRGLCCRMGRYRLIRAVREIREQLVQSDLVDCIVMLPTQLFYNTGISACLWFLSRYKNGNKNRDRKGEVLFIDASELGYRTHLTSIPETKSLAASWFYPC
ncbi:MULTISPECIES: N-6 DNA methylase [Cyanophyceae]|uniref:N-6 DNA methylase n=1 Tax=Cyanophyceae TaxID=3028117 RepID=UPI001F54C98B|nr:N-6 DNA methylase [Trichocoleus sp. FACHB-40]